VSQSACFGCVILDAVVCSPHRQHSRGVASDPQPVVIVVRDGQATQPVQARPAASSGWAGSAGQAMNGCAGCWCLITRAAARPGSKQMTDWLRTLLQRKPRKVAAVALANKIARIAWRS
jgi:hypothetical protein